MDKVSIIEKIRTNDKLLSLPQVMSEVLREVGKEDFSPDSLARIILKDPSLTGRTLRLSNSSFYHRFSCIKSVNQAISVLGVTTVKCLALSSSIFHPEKVARKSGVDPKAFFSYVLSVASASEKIARSIEFKSPDEAFVAGLLHDIGVLFFLHHYPSEYHQIIDKKVRAANLLEAEIKVFGIDHCEVARHLAKVWNLPDYIVSSITGHHRLTDLDKDSVLQNIVRLAVLMTSDHFSGYEMGLQQRLTHIKSLSDQLSLSKEQVNGISCSLLSGTIDIANYLGIDIGNIEELLMKANEEIWKSYLTIENLFKERQELTQKLLNEERAKGALESRNIAMATLSHYLNNAVMAIYGRSQIMRMLFDGGQRDKLLDEMPTNMEAIDRAVQRIVAVLEEMKEISPIDHEKFDSMSAALNIDDRIEKRLAKMSDEAPMAALRSAVTPEPVSTA
jgi:two-component system cell cycle response regulator